MNFVKAVPRLLLYWPLRDRQRCRDIQLCLRKLFLQALHYTVISLERHAAVYDDQTLFRRALSRCHSRTPEVGIGFRYLGPFEEKFTFVNLMVDRAIRCLERCGMGVRGLPLPQSQLASTTTRKNMFLSTHIELCTPK